MPRAPEPPKIIGKKEEFAAGRPPAVRFRPAVPNGHTRTCSAGTRVQVRTALRDGWFAIGAVGRTFLSGPTRPPHGQEGPCHIGAVGRTFLSGPTRPPHGQEGPCHIGAVGRTFL